MKKMTKTPARQSLAAQPQLSPNESKEMQINFLEKKLAQAEETIKKQEQEIIYLKTQLARKDKDSKKLPTGKVEYPTQSEEILRTPPPAPSSSFIQTQKIKSSSQDLKQTERKIDSDSLSLVRQNLNFQSPISKSESDSFDKEKKYTKSHRLSEDEAENSRKYTPESKHKTKNHSSSLKPFFIETPLYDGLDREEKNNFLDELDQLFHQPDSKNIIFSENQPKLKSRQYIFKLNRSFWPILPMGYRWLITSKSKQMPIIQKYQDFPDDQKIQFAIYGPNEKKQVNYLTLFNDTTVQSYANSRNRTYEFEKDKNLRVIPEDGRHIDAGHCIDQKDTMNEAIKDTDYLSGDDPLNIIPEPATWNQRIRNHLVRHSIRAHDGAYLQRIYYDDCHLYKFYSQDKATRFCTGEEPQQVSVPSGVYLAAINAERTQFQWALDVSWQYPFGQITYDGGKKNKGPGYKRAITQLSIPKPFASMAVALTRMDNIDAAEIDEKMAIYQVNLNHLQILPTEKEIGNKEFLKHTLLKYKRALFEQLYHAAETEIFPFYQLYLSLMCAQLGDVRSASLYLNRATTHLNLMEDNFATRTESVPLISKSTFNFLKQMSRLHPELDLKDKNQEIWKNHVLDL